MRGSEALVKMLDQAQVEVVFGLCGDTSLPFYEAMVDLKPNFRHVLTRDERSASFMADAYSRLSGRVGVCEGPSGGGATYILPGLAEANQSSVPLVCLTTDINLADRWRGTLTEMDQEALFEPVTSFARTPLTAGDLPRTLRQAFRTAVSGRMGAVQVGLPMNVQEGEVAEAEVYVDSALGRYPFSRSVPEPDSVRRAAELLEESRFPVILAGAGVIRAGAWHELTALAHVLGAPVATSISGKGAIAETDPFSLGVVGGNGGLPWRQDILAQADLVFLVGCQAGSVTTSKWSLPRAGGASIVQLDVDPLHLGRNYPLAAGLVADAKLGLAAILDRLGDRPLDKVDPEIIARKRVEHLARLEGLFQSGEMPIRPERFLTEFFAALPDGAVLLTDPGTPTPYISAYWRQPRAGRFYATPRAHGALGYALPGVVGAFFARPGARAVGLMGDGSFAISAGELETIARLNLPLTLIVLTNACFGWVKAGQKTRGGKYFGVDFSCLDHARIARAFGLSAARVEDPAGLAPALKKALTSPGPFLLDVVVQPLHEAQAPVSKWIA